MFFFDTYPINRVGFDFFIPLPPIFTPLDHTFGHKKEGRKAPFNQMSDEPSRPIPLCSITPPQPPPRHVPTGRDKMYPYPCNLCP